MLCSNIGKKNQMFNLSNGKRDQTTKPIVCNLNASVKCNFGSKVNAFEIFVNT